MGPRPPEITASRKAVPTSRKVNGTGIRARLLQQELLAKLAVVCLRGTSEQDVLNEAARIAAEGLNAPFSKIAEYLPEENRLLIRAGVGWKPGVVGAEKLDADVGSPSGFAFRAEQAVVCNNLDDEPVFQTPPLLRQYGIKRTITVSIRGDGRPFGVLEADSDAPGAFATEDLPFLQSAAKIVGVALEHHRAAHELRAALQWEKVLCDEMNHRIKNNLQLAATALLLDAGTSETEAVRARLQEASCRISAIGRVHENLSMRATHGQKVEMGAYLRDLRPALAAAGFPCETEVDDLSGLEISSDYAIPIGLILTELVTNSFKHGGRAQDIRVTIHAERTERDAVVAVIDNGPGLPGDLDLSQSRRLGMRIIEHLKNEIGATLQVNTGPSGTEVWLRIPLRALERM